MEGLADVASALSTRPAGALPLSSGMISYEVNDKITRLLIRFLIAIGYLFDIHMRLRFAGKGATFRKPIGKRFLPQQQVSNEMRQAIDLYDRRVVRAQLPFRRVGTEISAKTKNTDSMMVVQRTNPIYIEAPLGKGLGFVETRFVPKFVSVDALQRINHDLRFEAPALWSPNVATLATFLRCGFEILASSRSGPANLSNVGYLIVKETSFHKSLAKCWSDVLKWQENLFPTFQPIRDSYDLLRRLKTIRGSLWPLQIGPVVREFEDGLCLDLYAATNLLETMFEFPAEQGVVANIRARHFELAVQKSINASQWRPPKDLLALRGVGLRLGGREITDVDALGARDDRLLIISCKSVIYSKDYDAGDYRLVRNIASNARESVESWSRIVKTILENPVGDNYDFSLFSRVVGTVCTPDVIYVPLGPCTELIAADLLALITLEELREWLAAH